MIEVYSTYASVTSDKIPYLTSLIYSLIPLLAADAPPSPKRIQSKRPKRPDLFISWPRYSDGLLMPESIIFA